MPSRPQPQREETSGKAFVEAISHPIRSKITLILEHGPATAAELVVEIGAPARTVRYHLGVLRRLGFVSVQRQVARRNVFEYTFIGSVFGYVDDELYGELTSRERRKVTNHYLRVIARGVTRFMASGTTYDEHFPLTARIVLALDEDGWRRLIAICSSAIEQMVDLRRELGERQDEPPGFEAEVMILALEAPGNAPKRSEI